MSEPLKSANSEQIKADLVAIEEVLARASTQRQLYFEAYTYIMTQLYDMQNGMIKPVRFNQRAALLRECMADHLHRVQTTSALGTPPAPGTRR